MSEEKITSPHAELQAALSQLKRLNPRRRVPPAFSTRDMAERVVAVAASAPEQHSTLAPVWQIDHDDLAGSEIIAWTLVGRPN